MAALAGDRSEQARRESEAEVHVRNQARTIDALLGTIENLKTKLAMRDQQLREADAELARLKSDKAPVDTASEPREAIVAAAIRWRRGADRGELAAAVDGFTGDGPLDVMAARFSGAMRANPDVANEIFNKMVADLRNARGAPGDPFEAAERFLREQTQTAALRPEQYADGAGAQAWRQAMGGEQ